MRVSSRNSDVLKFVGTLLTIVKCYIRDFLYDFRLFGYDDENLMTFLQFYVFQKWGWWEACMGRCSFISTILQTRTKTRFFTFHVKMTQFILK